MSRRSALVAFIVLLTTLFQAQAFAPKFGVKVPRNTELFVKIKIAVGNGEPIESAIRRFKREVNKSGHLMELRHKRYFENSQEKVKRKTREARMRKKFERMNQRRMANRT